MLRLLLLLRPLLPAAFSQALLERFWLRFWQREQLLEEEELGREAEQPIRGSERAVLIEEIAGTYPFSSVLEIGCGYGQNFHVLTQLFPRCRFVGIDRDAVRIEQAQRLLDEQGAEGVLLVEGNAEELSDFGDNSADIVLSSAMLLYVGPDQIERVLQEMLRVAKKYVLILEQHTPGGGDADSWRGDSVAAQDGRQAYWLRDYQVLLERFVEA